MFCWYGSSVWYVTLIFGYFRLKPARTCFRSAPSVLPPEVQPASVMFPETPFAPGAAVADPPPPPSPAVAAAATASKLMATMVMRLRIPDLLDVVSRSFPQLDPRATRPRASGLANRPSRPGVLHNAAKRLQTGL